MDLPKHLPVHTLKAGTALVRIHTRGREALWFGPTMGSPPINRFDDPQGEFRVCYLGTNREACFAETFLRNPPVTILALEDLKERDISELMAERSLKLAALHGAGLAKMGVTAEVSSAAYYGPSQSWSRAVWMHANKVDGIAYRARHDDSKLCVALYDRARDKVRVAGGVGLAKNQRWLAEVLARYGVGLTTK